MGAEDRVAGAVSSISTASVTGSTWVDGPQDAVAALDERDEGHGGQMTTPLTSSGPVTTTDRNTIEFDEAALAAASIAGDPKAFEELYTHYFPKVRALCIRKIGNAHLAEDIAQEAFARAFQRISEFGGPRHFGGWVGTIAANLCTDFLRRKKPVASVDQMLEDNESNTPTYEFDPIRNVQQEDTSRLVRLALAKLDPRQREALVLHEIKGLSCSAVGDRLGISEVAAESLLARARRRLRKEVTAKAIPADLFGLGGLGLLPSMIRAWKRARESTSNRISQVQVAAHRSWEAVGANMLPSMDAAKALVIVVGAALATQVATAASPSDVTEPRGAREMATAADATGAGLVPSDGDLGEGGRENPGLRAPLTFHADPETRTAAASFRGEVTVPDPTGEDGEAGLHVDLDVVGEGTDGEARVRLWVEESDGSTPVDTGEISRSTHAG